MKSIGPTSDPLGTPCFTVSQSENKLQASLDGFVSTFFVPSVK
jgi:hypothetical protein